ncbi:hypothetical protein D9M71_800150 [compost metagenome]
MLSGLLPKFGGLSEGIIVPENRQQRFMTIGDDRVDGLVVTALIAIVPSLGKVTVRLELRVQGRVCRGRGEGEKLHAQLCRQRRRQVERPLSL